FTTKQSYLREDEEHIRKLTKAIYRAHQRVDEHSAEEVANVISPYFEDVDHDILTASTESYKSQRSFATYPILHEDEWTHLQLIMEEAGELPNDAPYEHLVNTTIAEEVSD